MNKEILSKMKMFYENAIVEKLSEALGVDKKNITSSWTIDETKARVDMTGTETVTTFNFTYKNENLTVEMESYKVLFNEVNGNRYINGVQAKTSTVDLQTMMALQNIFQKTLEQDFVEEEESKPEIVEESPINE